MLIEFTQSRSRQTNDNAKNYLKPDITFEILGKFALNQADDLAAEQLQKERSKLFKTINERDLKSS